jgi:phosphatidylglycerophosphate synthase
MVPLRAIIAVSVALRIHPNTLTLIGVLINVAAAVALGKDQFMLAGVIMIVANIFDFIDGKVAHITNTVTRFGAFWDSTLDRFSDIALFLGLIYLYATSGRTGYVMVTSLAMMFSIMTSYARRRARVAHRQVQGRLHGAARAHRALHDRRLHGSDGGGDVGDPDPVDRHRLQPHPLHVPGAEQPAHPERTERPDRGPLARVLLAGRSAPRSLRSCGWWPSSRSSG